MKKPEIIRELIKFDFKGMNERQFEAVTQVKGALLVLAGAGSGKTTVLVNRIANLVRYGDAYTHADKIELCDSDVTAAEEYMSGKAPFKEGVFSYRAPRAAEILAITFTNKAAGELKERIERKLGAAAEGIWAGTFHSICGKILRMNAERIGYSSHFTIYDADDQKRLMKEIIKAFSADEKMFSPKSVLSAISSAKDSMITPDEYEQASGADLRRKTISKLYKEYNSRLKAADAMDFDDMILNAVKLLSENPDVLERYGSRFKYIMVDEYQDTNHAQYELVHLLSSVHGNICVVGDDDQSIYRFRGATIENILNFEDDYEGARVIRLEQNYRSTGNILSAANAVIANNLGRKGKTLWTAEDEGELIDVYTAESERGEAKYVCDKILDSVRAGAKFSDHAVLYRVNAQSAAVENVFARSGVSYRVIGGMRFYERKEIRDVLAYLNLINNHNDNIRLRRIINEPKRSIGDATVNKAAEIAEANGISLFEVISSAQDYPILSRALPRLCEFSNMIKELSRDAETMSISELAEAVLIKSGYRTALSLEGTPESADRLLNIDELLNTMRQYELENDTPSLSSFLEEIALVSDIDSMNESDDKVTLMTIHSAKGLEFPNVFLIGLEEGIFPGNQSIYGGNTEIEEERRLAYVAITRAKHSLHITLAATRMLYGSTGRNLPSRFLKEIPTELCSVSSAELYSSGYGSYSYGYREDSGSRLDTNEGGYVYGRKAFTGGVIGSYSAKKPENKAQTGIYCAGQTVEHKTFGKGLILSVSSMGNDNLLEIAFEGVGTKKLMAGYAKLKILS